MSADTLDYLYSPSKYSKHDPSTTVDRHIEILRNATKASRDQLRCELGVEYLSGGQKIDFYYPSCDLNDDTCVLIFIHGGYWQALSLEESGCHALPLAANNIILASVGYDLAPLVNMTTIVDQCRLACAFIAKRFPKYRLFVSGNSAGGHLAALMLSTDWTQYGLTHCPLYGGILISGVYDLSPIQKCYVNEPLQLTDHEVKVYSPLNISALHSLSYGVLFAEGEFESPEFKRQREEYSKFLKCNGVKVCDEVILANEDHFTIMERLQEETYTLTKIIIGFIRQK